MWVPASPESWRSLSWVHCCSFHGKLHIRKQKALLLSEKRVGAFVTEDKVSSGSCVIASFRLSGGPNTDLVNVYTTSHWQARTFLEIKEKSPTWTLKWKESCQQMWLWEGHCSHPPSFFHTAATRAGETCRSKKQIKKRWRATGRVEFKAQHWMWILLLENRRFQGGPHCGLPVFERSL